MQGNNLKNINLVVVDDEAQIVHYLQKSLSSLCKTFFAFTSALDVLKHIEEYPIDILVCDIRMPQMNGIELCKQIKSIKSDVILVMLSASNDSNYLVEAINMGINKFLMKPYRTRELITVLEEFALQIESQREAKIYNDFVHEKFQINHQNFDEVIYQLNQYKNAIDSTNLVRKMNMEGKITSINKKFKQIKHISKKELLSIKPSTFEKVLKKIDKKGLHSTIHSFKNKTFLQSVYFPIYNLDDQLEEVIEISQDISKVYHLNEEIYKTQEAIIFMLSTVIEQRSKETAAHVQRVALYSDALAKYYGLSKSQRELLVMASPLHDVGKVSVPDDILTKPSTLTPEEFEIIKGHTTTGYEILKDSKNKVLNAAAIIAHEHHENWDGTGYPKGLEKEEIHIFSRITALADVFDALAHNRCYKKAWSLDRVKAYFEEQIGKKFEPKLVDIFLNHFDEFVSIKNSCYED